MFGIPPVRVCKSTPHVPQAAAAACASSSPAPPAAASASSPHHNRPPPCPCCCCSCYHYHHRRSAAVAVVMVTAAAFSPSSPYHPLPSLPARRLHTSATGVRRDLKGEPHSAAAARRRPPVHNLKVKYVDLSVGLSGCASRARAAFNAHTREHTRVSVVSMGRHRRWGRYWGITSHPTSNKKQTHERRALHTTPCRCPFRSSRLLAFFFFLLSFSKPHPFDFLFIYIPPTHTHHPITPPPAPAP